MLPPKIKLTAQILHGIKAARIAKRIPAATLSKAINRDDSYISSLELKRLRTISSADLIAILCVIFSIPEHEAMSKAEELIGIGTTAGSEPDQEFQAPLALDGGENATMVSEAAFAYYRHDSIT